MESNQNQNKNNKNQKKKELQDQRKSLNYLTFFEDGIEPESEVQLELISPLITIILPNNQSQQQPLH